MSAAETFEAAAAQLDYQDPDYYVTRNELETQFKKDLAAAYLAAGTTQEVADATYSLAYSQGHSNGYSEVESFYIDLAPLVNLATASANK